MLIRLSELKTFPCLMMMVFALQTSLAFNAIDMLLASYALLALMLVTSIVSFYLILRQRIISRSDFFSIVFLAIVTISSAIHGTDIEHWIHICFAICLLRFMFNYYHHNLNPLIIGLAIGFCIAVVVQFLQLIMNPSMWMIEDLKDISNYILGGNYNQMGIRLLAALITNLLCIRIHKFFWFSFILCLITGLAIPFMVGSMTAVTCIVIFLFLCAIPLQRFRQVSVVVLFISVILFQVFVCFNGKGVENNELMVWLIEDVLGKDITFTYRTYMWDSALRIISQSPILGYGFPDNDWYIANMSSFAIGPHNIILAVLVYGGAIALLLYLCIMAHSVIQLLRAPGYYAECIAISISVVCLMMLMEAYPMSLVFMFFILAEYYPDLYNKNTKKG